MTNNDKVPSALDLQVGGNHYKRFKIQPGVFCHLNNLTLFEGNIIKYVTRHAFKHGIEDLKKAIHCIQLIEALHGEQGHALLPAIDKWTIDPITFCTENKLDVHQSIVVCSVCFYSSYGLEHLTHATEAINTMIKTHYHSENK